MCFIIFRDSPKANYKVLIKIELTFSWDQILDMTAGSVKASLERAWQVGQWTDVVLVGGDQFEVRQ